jgi:hypothetical protein
MFWREGTPAVSVEREEAAPAGVAGEVYYNGRCGEQVVVQTDETPGVEYSLADEEEAQEPC